MPSKRPARLAVPPTTTCNAKNRKGGLCHRPAGWGTPHPGQGRCKFHGGLSLVRSGRYSKITRPRYAELIAEHAADPDPLNILPELAAARALFQDFIERYDAFSEALLAWHASWRGLAPITEERLLALGAVLDEYEELLASQAPTARQRQDLTLAREALERLREVPATKPTQLLDVSDAYRIVAEITKIVERIERIRSANAISRPDLLRVMAEMGRVVEAFVQDDAARQQIREGWLQIRVA
jgi:hypothetical protein